MLGIRTTAKRAQESLAFSGLVRSPRRLALLRRAGWTGLRDCWLSPGCVFDGSEESRPTLRVGDGTFINYGVVITTHAPVSIGARVDIGHGAKLLTISHDPSDPAHRAGTAIAKPIAVGDGAWIGAGAILLPGVTVGPGAVIAAGAVVTHDCEPDALYMGVPARRARSLPTA